MVNRRLLADAWNVSSKAPLLWLAVFLPSAVPAPPSTDELWLAGACLFPLLFLLGVVSSAAVPGIVLRAHRGAPPGLKEAWAGAVPAMLRVLVFYLLLIIPAALFLIAPYLWPVPWRGVNLSPAAARIASLALQAFAGAIVSLALAGIVIHRLNGLRALVNALLIAFNNPLATLGLVGLVLLSAVPGLLINMIQTRVPLALYLPWCPEAPALLQPWVLADMALQLVTAVAGLPVLVYFSALAVLVYDQATQKVAYPWIGREQAG